SDELGLRSAVVTADATAGNGITTGVANDTITGGGGNDTLNGGSGNDTISGGLEAMTRCLEAAAATS
ncbi:hypothetical protein CO650_27170, partial [Rhizobium phaseoli]